MSENHQGVRCHVFSPNITVPVKENLKIHTKISKVLLELVQKLNSINNDTANHLLSVSENFTKKLNEIEKERSHQNESFVQFLHTVISGVSNHGKLLQMYCKAVHDGVISQMQQENKRAKKKWKSCFHYVETLQENIKKREEELLKCRKDHNEAVAKGKTSGDLKFQSFIGNSHNARLLQSVSVNTANKMLCTSVLPNIIHTIEESQENYGKNLKIHLKRFFTIQKEITAKFENFFQDNQNVVEQLDSVKDLQQCVEYYRNSGCKVERTSKFGHSIRKSFHIQRTSTFSEPLMNALIVNEATKFNLKQSLEILKQERSEILDEKEILHSYQVHQSPSQSQESLGTSLSSIQDGNILRRSFVFDLNNLFAKFDNEIHLKVIEKQLEYFSSTVLKSLDKDSGNTLRCMTLSNLSTSLPELRLNSISNRTHRYLESRLVKPQVCIFCNKWLPMVTKSLSCSVCKITVHKRCATNVPFCDETVINDNYSDVTNLGRRSVRISKRNLPILPIFSKKWERYVVPSDPRDDEDHYYVELFEQYEDESSDSDVAQATVNVVHEDSQKVEQSAVNPLSVEHHLYYHAEGNSDNISRAVSTPDLRFEENIYLTSVDSNLPRIVEEDNKSPIYERIWSQTRDNNDKCDQETEHVATLLSISHDYAQIRRHSMPEFFTFPASGYEVLNLEENINTLNHIYAKPSVRENKTISQPSNSDRSEMRLELSSLPTGYEVMLPSSPLRKAYVNKTSPPVLPSPFVFRKNDVEGKPRLRRRSSSLNNVLEERTRICVALYDYHATNGSEISFNAGAKIEVVEKFNSDWWRGCYQNVFGFFPSKYAFDVNPNDVILRVVYDFTRQRDKQISVSVGQILIVIRKEGNWYYVKCPEGEGYVPESYVENADREFTKICKSSTSWSYKS